jgi:hypothetical protein
MKGVTAYIKLENDENIKLVLNDVNSTSETDTPDWTHSVLFTSNSYSEKSLKELSLSKEQFAEIGENLIIRLLALNGLLK